MQTSRSSVLVPLVLALSVALGGCKGDDEDDGTDLGSEAGDLPAGSTAIVVVLNPIPNDGHSVGLPSITGSAREGVAVNAEPGGEDVTDPTGIAVVGAEVGNTALLLSDVETPPELALDVLAAGDVYDAAVAFDGAGAEYFELTPIRYPVGQGSGAVFIEPGTAISDIEAELAVDEVVVVLRPGVYTGDLTITGRGVLLFGEGFSENNVVIDGSVSALGEAVRLRGLTIAGNVTSAGNNFGMSFSEVRGDASITGNGGAFLRNVFCGQVSVPTDNAALLDNYGIAPLLALPDGACEDDTDSETGG
jgi:hypothetical protein